MPPSPVPSDHWCLYVRVLSEQAPIGTTEGPSIPANVQASNNLIWRNLQVVVNSTDSATFTVRNEQRRAVQHTLRIDVPDAFLSTGRIRLLVPRSIAARWKHGTRLDGIEFSGPVRRDSKEIPSVLTTVLHDPKLRSQRSARELELDRRIFSLHSAIRACGAGRKSSTATVPRRSAVAVDRQIDPRRESELLETIKQLERRQRACARNDETLVAYTLTKPRASIVGISLKARGEDPITIEFSNHTTVRDQYPVLVVQEASDGALIGGNTYLVRTGGQ